MREAMALVRANWLRAKSYRLNLILSVAALLVSYVPVYYVAQALQKTMAESIRNEGGQYFAFLLVGMVTFSFLMSAVNTLPSMMSTAITNGTLEALLATPARVSSVLAGMSGYDLLWTGTRGLIILVAGWIFGAKLLWSHGFSALLIVLLVVAAYASFGVIGAAMVLAFRTTGPLAQGIILVSGLLGGVYYPTHSIPGWIQGFSAVIPLTYGLHALRRSLLEGVSFTGILPDVAILAAFAVGLLGVSAYAFARALRYARQAGTLAQY